MKRRLLFFFGFILLFIQSCVIDTATAPEKKEFHVYLENGVLGDKIWLKKFEKQNRTKVFVHYLNAEKIISLLNSKPFDSNIDALIFESPVLKTMLLSKKKIKKIFTANDLSALHAPFQREDRRLFPLSHDPLILSILKDTSGKCETLNFLNWARKNDSVKPVLSFDVYTNLYVRKLKKSKSFSYFTNSRLKKINPKQQVRNLSHLIRLQLGVKIYCHYFLPEKRSYLTRNSYLCFPKYNRNPYHAQKFLAYLKTHLFDYTKARNQLPCVKKCTTSAKISALEIR